MEFFRESRRTSHALTHTSGDFNIDENENFRLNFRFYSLLLCFYLLRISFFILHIQVIISDKFYLLNFAIDFRASQIIKEGKILEIRLNGRLRRLSSPVG